MPVVWYFNDGSKPIISLDTRPKRVDGYLRTWLRSHEVDGRIITLDPIHFTYCMTSFVRQVSEISEIIMVREWQKSEKVVVQSP